MVAQEARLEPRRYRYLFMNFPKPPKTGHIMFQSFITLQLNKAHKPETIDEGAILSELSNLQKTAEDFLYRKRRGYINHVQFIEALRALDDRRTQLKRKLQTVRK